MAQYWGHAFRRFSKLEAGPVRVSSTVIYLDRKQFRPDPGAFEANDGEGTSGLFGYRVLRLWELDAKAFLRSARPGLAPFAPLMSTRDPAGTVAQSKQKIIEAGPEEATARKKAELCGALFALSGLVIDDRDLLFKLIWEDWMGLERSVTVQWLMERGEARGLEMGRAQLLEARREDVLAVLEASL
jgi:predicted transposase YdaD